jgi:hypothetical protein
MNKEYNLMTTAPQETIIKLLNSRGYKKLQLEKWEVPLFRNNSMIGIKLENVDESNFDMYQGERRGKEGFVDNPKFSLYSDIENSLMEIDEELLMEEGKLKEPLDDRKTIESKVKEDFISIVGGLKNSGFKTDFYETEEGFNFDLLGK